MSQNGNGNSEEQSDLIGRWSEQKLALLKKYLMPYVTILSKQKWCTGYEYIDAFAGTGKPKTKDEQVYVDGSPRVALSLSTPFTQYHFVEETSWRVKKLEALQKEFHKLSIAIYHGDCNAVLKGQIIPQLDNRKKRAIAFIDPFGMNMQWQTMEALAKVGTIEAFINVPFMAVNRSVLKKRPENISAQDKDRMKQFWGGDDWLKLFYKDEPTLFGPEQTKIPETSLELGSHYRKRLKTIFQHCTEPILMANSKGSLLYYIIFAGHNSTGVKIANDIFKKYQGDK